MKRGIAFLILAVLVSVFAVACSKSSKNSCSTPSEPCGASGVTIGIEASVSQEANPAVGIPGIRVRFRSPQEPSKYIDITSNQDGKLTRTEISLTEIPKQFEVTTFDQPPTTGTFVMIDELKPYVETTDPANGKTTLGFDIRLRSN